VFNEIAPYLYQTALAFITLITLLKDWEDFGKKSGRWSPIVMVILTVVLIVLGIQQTRAQIKKERDAAQEAKTENDKSTGRIGELTKQVAELRAEDDRRANTYQTSLSGLYDRLTDLRSKVRNQDLIKELDATKKEVLVLQQKLTQPKAALFATLNLRSASYDPVTTLLIPRPSDNAVTIEFAAVNPTDTQALNGSIGLRICKECRYAEEPLGSVRLAGAADTDREFQFQHMFAKSQSQTISARVRFPAGVPSFKFGVFIACETCVAGEVQSFTVQFQ
jgi:hypothetical protein